MIPNALLTVEECATLVGVSTRSVRRWISDGLLLPDGARGRAKLYRVKAVYEAEQAARSR